MRSPCLIRYLVARFVLLFALCLSPAVLAWPADSDWIAIQKNQTFFSDDETDFNNQFNLVGPGYTSVYVFNDGIDLHFRFRIDADPLTNQNTLTSFGWGVLIDTDGDLDSYEYMIMLDGITEELYLAQNTSPTTIGDPSDKAETIQWQQNAVNGGNYRVITPIDSTFNGDDDYFLDFKVPYVVFKTALGVDDSSLIKYFFGTSASAQTLSKDLSGSDLYTGTSDFTLPTGTTPADGTVCFADATYTCLADGETVPVNDPLYIRVVDADLNAQGSVVETATVSVQSGAETETGITLIESSAGSGIFVGSIDTSNSSNTAGVLYVSPTEVLTVTYVDEATATYDIDVNRTDTVTIVPYTDLGVEITVDNATPFEESTVIYTITVTNNGPVNSFSSQILLSQTNNGTVDEVPGAAGTGMTFSSWSVATSDAAVGGGSYNSTTGYWNMGHLPVGESATLTLTMATNALTAGQTVVTGAEITASSLTDFDSSNDVDSATISIEGADLAITKTVDDSTPGQGDTINYAITVTNNGLANATNVVVTDALPDDSEFLVTGTVTTPVSTGTVTTPGAPCGPCILTWDSFDVDNGDSVTLTITGTVQASSGTTFDNTAGVTADQTDPNGDDNSATATVSVGGTDVSIVKSADDLTPSEGSTVTYTVVVTNLGDNDATAVTVTDSLPDGVTFDVSSSSATEGSVTEPSGCTSNCEISWTGISLTGGIDDTATLTYTVTVDSGTASTTQTNTAAVDTGSQLDEDPSNDSASVSIVVGYADLEVIKTPAVSTPADNETVTFTIVVRNKGPSSTTNVVVTDYLPAYMDNVTLVSVTDGTFNTTTGIWTLGTLDAPSTPGAACPGTITSGGYCAELQFSADVDVGPSDPLSFYNTATVTASDEVDLVASNNSSSVLIKVGGTNLAVFKLQDTSAPNEGDQVTYTIILSNEGPNDASGVVVKDLLPAGLTYVSDTATIGSYASGSGNWTFGNNDTMTAGTSETLTIVASVDGGTTGNTITNTVQFQSADQGDTDSTDNTASVTLTVGATDLSVAKSASPTSANEGDTVTYTVVVTNLGDNPVSGVEVTDLLDDGVTYDAGSFTVTDGATTVTEPGGGCSSNCEVVWSGISLAAGIDDAETLTYTVTIDAGNEGTTLINTAEITASSAPDPDEVNNVDTASVSVPIADFTISKIVNDATPFEEDPIEFTVTINNVGPNGGTNVEVIDTIPLTLLFNNDTSTIIIDEDGLGYLGTVTVTDDGTNAIITWNGFDLAKDSSANLNYTMQVAADAFGSSYSNYATVDSDVYDDSANTDNSDVPDLPDNNSTSIEVTPQESIEPELTVDKTVDDPDSIVSSKQVLTYTIEIQNIGDGVAKNVTIEDDISDFTALAIDPWSTGSPFKFVDGTSPSGYTDPEIMSIECSIDSGPFAPCSFVDTRNGASSGFDGGVSAFIIYMDSTEDMAVAPSSFTIQYKLEVQ